MTPHPITGIVLAAGAGSRMGMPKALKRTADGAPWLHLAIRLLRDAGCDQIIVVLGAAESEARAVLESTDPTDPDVAVEIVIAERWAEGMSESLRAGIAAASATATAVLVIPVDMPGLPVSVMRRVVDCAPGPAVLRQAVYGGRPGHPVLIGRDHVTAVLASLHGDRGARQYLASHGAEEIECGDVFDGHDIDTTNDGTSGTTGDPASDSASDAAAHSAPAPLAD